MGNKSARNHSTPEEVRRKANEAEWARPLKKPISWKE
jgi:hypothetical protein